MLPPLHTLPSKRWAREQFIYETCALRFIPGPPKRFAQLVGLMFSTTCMVLAFLERRLAMVIVAVLLFVASFLSGLFDTCPACVVFG